MLTEHDTYETVTLASAREGAITRDAPRKITKALALFETHVDGDDLLDRIDVARSEAVTPLMFEYTLLDRARAQPRHIVLPEGTDERVLRAADILLRRRVVELTLLGPEAEVRGTAGRLGLDLYGAHVLDPADPELVERFAAEYAARRAHKGVTVDQARDVVSDVSYFGTLMVALGMVDGMVSGATHTTAETIRPAFELVKTRPDVSIVSSVFLMCLADRVLVYGDCAVNPHPTAEQLADIAISSAQTAAQFGIEPRVAMLSYSTGTLRERRRRRARARGDRAGALAGAGAVGRGADPVRRRRRRQRRAHEAARTAPSRAARRCSSSPTSTPATTRTRPSSARANAIAIGPVLQGLNKPVNDLSRGATVHDIVNTVAITAIQAQ